MIKQLSESMLLKVLWDESRLHTRQQLPGRWVGGKHFRAVWGSPSCPGPAASLARGKEPGTSKTGHVCRSDTEVREARLGEEGANAEPQSQKRVQIYSSNKIHRLLFWGANVWTHEKKLQIPNTSEETATTGSVRYIWPRAGATNKLPRGQVMCSRQAVP